MNVCAHSATRTKQCKVEAQHRDLATRRGYMRSIVAFAHMLRVIYVVLKTGKPYCAALPTTGRMLVKRNAPR